MIVVVLTCYIGRCLLKELRQVPVGEACPDVSLLGVVKRGASVSTSLL